MDGLPTLRFNEFLLASLASNRVELGPTRTSATGVNLPPPTELKFELDARCMSYIDQACKHFDELVGKHELEVSVTGPVNGCLRLIVFPGAALRRIWERRDQEVQSVAGCMGAAGETARAPQDV